MCGIAGCLDVHGDAPAQREDLLAAIAAVHHRGPDSKGLLVDGAAGLAHARLAIIDLAGGQQPIHNEDNTVWVVFNGEIFNYVELRAELEQRGHRFYTASDTEVIVHSYEEHAEHFVDCLNGQFAIALWDSRKQKLVLARDRVGIRPLYYTSIGSRFWFASEIKALFAVPGATRRLNPRGLAETLTFWSPMETTDWFEGMKPLSAGFTLTLDLGAGQREPVLHRYWDWPFTAEPEHGGRSVDECAEELRELLIDAVKLQLRSDVPVGAYLSGGLDSSVITTLIKRYTQTPLRTFSLAFENAELDESAHQDVLVHHLEAEHSRMLCSRDDIGRRFPRALWHAEVPLVRTAATPMMLLSGLVRQQGYKVVLSGEGSDEVFAGYDLFKEAQVRRFWARQPSSLLRPRILQRLYPYLDRSPAAVPEFARHFFSVGLDRTLAPYFGHLPRWTTTRRTWRFLSDEIRGSLAGWDPYASLAASLPADIGTWPPLSRDQYIEAHTLLSTYLLSSQGDRMAMANSIEARVPFLDHRVVELAARLPPSFKLFGLREKYILKRSMRDLLPPSITRRTKQPYRAPDAASFFRDGKPLPYVRQLLGPGRLRAAGYFDPVSTALLVEKCARGAAIGFVDNMAFVAVLSTMLVHEMFVARVAPFEVDAAPC